MLLLGFNGASIALGCGWCRLQSGERGDNLSTSVSFGAVADEK